MKKLTKWTASACIATGVVLAPTAAMASGSDNVQNEDTMTTHEVSDSGLIVANGYQGDIVETIQESLNAQGIFTKVDGIYGPQTEQNVKEFQSDEGLATDGIVGIETFPELIGDVELTGSIDYPNQLLMDDSYNLFVAHIQEILNDQGIDTRVDGIYGSETKNNVMQFQRSIDHLQVDGIVGPNTWEALFQRQEGSAQPSDNNKTSMSEDDDSSSNEGQDVAISSATEAIETIKQRKDYSDDIIFDALGGDLREDEKGSYYRVQLTSESLRNNGGTGTVDNFKVYQNGEYERIEVSF